jgi:RNA polymerase sigma factor (sigma-70 family)
MTQGTDEQELLTRLRGGQDEAFGELFEQHAPAVRRLARSLANDASEAEDITAETFFRVLRAIKRGNGPHDNVRGYLLTVARRVAWEWKGAAQDVPVTDDELTSRAGATEPAGARSAEYTLITRAFTSLPERWRTVLWRTEVEGAQPAVVAPHFGLSPNATAALARRARQGLRAAYLQAHLSTHKSNTSCRSVLDKLGSYTAGAVTPAEAARIAAHLGNCSGCRSTHDELRDVCHSLRSHAGAIAVALPAITGAGALAAGTGTAAAPGKVAALKSAFTGAKIKIGAAVASTAVVGVLGLSAGPVINDSAVDVLGLQGQQGYNHLEPTMQRGSGEDVSSISRRTTKRAPHQTNRMPQHDPYRAERSTGGSPETQATEATGKLSGTAEAEVPLTPGTQRKDVEAIRDLPDPSAEKPSGGPPSQIPESTPGDQPEEPVNKPALAPEEPPRTSYDDVAHDCVDDYEYYEVYNQSKGRTETYEYSYRDGEGYERTIYRYDSGEETSYTYYWHDEC